ncbi:sodium-dependent phosphate transport protein 2B-like [Liolophura sinensis]|uniref:sodium-dependent phosphate transport protein 2B-like n=1 Tax=Liolophura sinensis TaxID=3198878 RepID=UPI0031597690
MFASQSIISLRTLLTVQHLPDYKSSSSQVALAQEDEPDPWDLPEFNLKVVPWSDLSTAGKVKRVVWDYFLRFIVLLGLLYLFICSLSFLSNAFQLLGGKEAGEAFKNKQLLGNPVAGLMLGVLATVLVQSSSTSTSIVVAMVSAGALEVKFAVFIIMGANIGTSVTNTIVSITQISDKDQFRRAFAGATVHDMFNWLSVIILLIIEWASSFLYHFSNWLVSNVSSEMDYEDTELLKTITKPFTKLVISLDKNKIKSIATGKKRRDEISTIIKTCYSTKTNETCANLTMLASNETGNCSYEVPKEDCYYLFKNVTEVWDDKVIGAVLLVASLALMSISLILIVKLLQSILKGKVAKVIRKFLNSDFPGPLRYLTGYVAILIGCGVTIMVQSSSIFTSSLTPLVGMGVITVDRMYPLTLGSNIGTTFTAVLAALASDNIHDTLQIALCHLFFNICGIIIWYPIPFMRKVPINMAKFLGTTTAKYRWFAILYIILMFFLFPLSVFALSLPGWYVLLAVYGPFVILIVVILIVKFIQTKRPEALPENLRNWKWLPECLRSLAPLDRLLTRCNCCKYTRCCGCCDIEVNITDP